MTKPQPSFWLSVALMVIGFISGATSAGFVARGYVEDIKANAKDISELKLMVEAAIENHIQLGPHAGVPVALARLQEQVMKNGEGIESLREDIKNSTRDRYHRAEAARDREYLCTLNPELTCPPIPE